MAFIAQASSIVMEPWFWILKEHFYGFTSISGSLNDIERFLLNACFLALTLIFGAHYLIYIL